MPVNPLAKPKNAADVLLGQENEDAKTKRGYATADTSGKTVLGKPLNYDDIYNTKTVPSYIKAERDRINGQLPSPNSTPSVGAVRATGLGAADALSTGAASGVTVIPPSPVANPYLSRVSNGLNELFGTTPRITVAPNSGTQFAAGFGGATGSDLPDINDLTSGELTRYAELSRLTGAPATAEAAKSYENSGELGRQRFKEFLQTANPNKNLRHTGLTSAAEAAAQRINAY